MNNNESDFALTEFFNTLLFETPSGQRFTQDSPILGNVWLAYARHPHEPLDLILTVKQDKPTGKAAHELRKMVSKLRNGIPEIKKTKNKPAVAAVAPAPDLGILKQSEKKSIRLTYIPGQIAVQLYFDELLRVVLPLTPWWDQNVKLLVKLGERYKGLSLPDWANFPIDDPKNPLMHKWLVDGLMLMRQGLGGTVEESQKTKENEEAVKFLRELPVDFIWVVRIAGVIAHLANLKRTSKDTQVPCKKDKVTGQLDKEFKARNKYYQSGNSFTTDEKKTEKSKEDKISRKARELIAKAFLDLYKNWKSDLKDQPPEYYLWRVTRNRTAELAVNHSSLTVKADAAKRLFDISCQGITWAIIDSGIDRDHAAFKNHIEDDSNTENIKNRIVRTLDFTNLRDLLDPDINSNIDRDSGENAKPYDALVKNLVARRWGNEDEGNTTKEIIKENVEDELSILHERISKGQDVDWETLEPLITDNHPKKPLNDHGTHVAGILGADWIEESSDQINLPIQQQPRLMQGICPDINLIDCRVFRDEGDTDEFEILAAIQFLRWLNSRAGYTIVHGSNLSLSLVHEFRRYACGQTPICVECNEAVALGMVVVAAAGNKGVELEDFHLSSHRRGYRSINITDPGNAEHVITVGATHRKRPHEYGVSFFSSRGPTGDGRVKPDLVAPGEKIKAPTPDGGIEFKDGTSMAAPHVSGAAAMLMARHKELIGKPDKIKKILCSTATDLGRDKYFQGCGLVDILRALQSV